MRKIRLTVAALAVTTGSLAPLAVIPGNTLTAQAATAHSGYYRPSTGAALHAWHVAHAAYLCKLHYYNYCILLPARQEKRGCSRERKTCGSSLFSAAGPTR